MATEEIEISQLELAEDLAPDMVLPVETPTKTFATTLEKIRQFFGLDNKTNLNMDNLNADGKSLISSLGMPSDKYVNLTLGASGATYTAPANGYYSIAKKTTQSAQYLSMENSACGIGWGLAAHGANQSLQNYISAKKGDVVQVNYNAGGETAYFRFVYAEGEN